MNEKQRMMEAVYTNGFALDDARLFLDTHPTDRAAIDYYQQKSRLYQQALDYYEEKFGPLRPENGAMDGHWGWANGPWPWEGGM